MSNQAESPVDEPVVVEEKKVSTNVPLAKPEEQPSSFSIQRYIINVIVRSVFFLFPIPILGIIHYIQDKQFLPPDLNMPIYMDYLYVPLGLTIVVVGTIIGGILDIVLPSKYVIGGKVAVKSFNIGTLSWFEGLGFKVSLDIASNRKGIAVKEERE